MLSICILDARTLGKDIDLSKFDKFGRVMVYETTWPEEVVGRIKDQDIIITNKVILNESNLKEAKSLKIICLSATGTNNVDLMYTKSKNIPVTNVAGYSTDSVTQHTFAMLFSLLEKLCFYDQYVKSGEYCKNDVFTNLDRPFLEVKNKTWGIIGLGSIGRSVAEVAKAFGSRVIYYSTSGKNDNSEYERVELDKLLRVSDVVSIHAPLNPQTKKLIGYAQLKMMKKNSVLLNLGRGGIVDEMDLAKALDEDLIAGAGLDVLENEPILEENPLLKIKDKEKILITPHIAWGSIEARARLIDEITQNIEAFLRGEARNRVC